MKVSRLLLLVVALLTWPYTGCVTIAQHPCTKGGQPAHDDGKVGKGTKQCLQVRDGNGGYVNQGAYTEWHANGQRAFDGEYLNGFKNGKWREWDDKGVLLSEKWYESGQPVPGREEHPYNGLGPPPRPAPRATPSPLPTAKP